MNRGTALPILRMKEIRDMNSEDREARLRDLRAELIRLRALAKAGGVLENPSRIREIKKAIARILTVNREYELGQETK